MKRPRVAKGNRRKSARTRRQFFNGLGKWSLAIIAAVSALREGVQGLQSAIGSRFETGSGGAGDPRQQIAKKKKHRTGINRILTSRTTIGKSLIRDYYRLERQQPGGTTITGRISER